MIQGSSSQIAIDYVRDALACNVPHPRALVLFRTSQLMVASGKACALQMSSNGDESYERRIRFPRLSKVFAESKQFPPF